ncbi:TPA: tRNA 2-thiouridine(34) synthase MnmA [bacterium]|nr:tRNA 2-thiouridine(34) synthase MnmA [bacterium]
MNRRVLVGMSGGVDSSISCFLLKKKGYDIIGVTLKFFEEEERCLWIESAKNIADILKIPHYVVDVGDLFKKKVISYFFNEYRNGKTPSPCIMCNRYIKFPILLDEAKRLGCHFIATGHYARCENGFLKKGIDEKKDQSYFLYVLKREQINHILMPLGELTKEEVKKTSENIKLSYVEKKESQDICFIKGDYRRYFKPKEGPILKNGKIQGKHRGVFFYTIGQRDGIGIARGKPLYVIRIDKEKNAIIVGYKEELYKTRLIANRLNFIEKKANWPNRVSAKIRYQGKESLATIVTLEKGKIEVKFDEPQIAITPGQSVVFYDGDIVLGGGIIIG